MSLETPRPSRLPVLFLALGLVLGVVGVLGLQRLRRDEPSKDTPPTATSPAAAASSSSAAPATRGTTRAPQLQEGTFTVWFMIAPGNEELRAIASRATDGTEVWVMAPSWVPPSSSATDVPLRIKYESGATFSSPQALLNWAGTKPAIRPTFHGLNLSAFVHDTVVAWDGSAPRFGQP